jgi:hypothetical protein
LAARIFAVYTALMATLGAAVFVLRGVDRAVAASALWVAIGLISAGAMG